MTDAPTLYMPLPSEVALGCGPGSVYCSEIIDQSTADPAGRGHGQTPDNHGVTWTTPVKPNKVARWQREVEMPCLSDDISAPGSFGCDPRLKPR